ncbi:MULTISPECIES: metal-sulfur cluster assembly factor [unclassified Thermoactinomyces]|jgi:metal-sulfur cluster biosynthetic enzyme|uniref:metal-sulfur cluster assembly factor n=1 Tax=unclassified Thermoactinomyces TaxID=2634588 RepID=UPI0018DEC5FF|nr:MULTISPECIES: metal-sulfur cluster assembly factor [unclassified Thermoactinomyces]MBH8597731.1 metal-sulfur cluster assembly factor [Thermoactinomyces sp. CICC 10523]MBH8604073.1 metal-sulfur cluster assembly factor [Thermoactinomyces sp. CICC 10522]MBH8606393.1 metal-sulfur cluster assembly factor [Thermoactinomyces sp. CICC 10521]
MNVTKEEIIERLKDVYDPELGINVVDLGLIYDVDIKDNQVFIKMTLTTPGCPLHDTLSNGVKTALSLHPAIQSVEVEVVWDPPWTPEKISPEAKKSLGF